MYSPFAIAFSFSQDALPTGSAQAPYFSFHFLSLFSWKPQQQFPPKQLPHSRRPSKQTCDPPPHSATFVCLFFFFVSFFLLLTNSSSRMPSICDSQMGFPGPKDDYLQYSFSASGVSLDQLLAFLCVYFSAFLKCFAFVILNSRSQSLSLRSASKNGRKRTNQYKKTALFNFSFVLFPYPNVTALSTTPATITR